MIHAPPAQTLPAFCVTSPADPDASPDSNSEISDTVLSDGCNMFNCKESFAVKVVVQPENTTDMKSTQNRISINICL